MKMQNWTLPFLMSLYFIFISADCKQVNCIDKTCENIEANSCEPCNAYKFDCKEDETNTPYKCDDLIINFQQLTCTESKDFLMQVLSDYNESNGQDLSLDGFLENFAATEVYTNCDSIELLSLSIDLLLSQHIKNLNIQQKPNVLVEIIDSSTMKKCMCNEDLIIYNNPTIQMEGDVVQIGNRHLSQGEGGGHMSLNYYIEPDNDMPNKFARSYDSGRMSRLYSPASKDEDKPNNQKPVIAFLDSGIDPNLFEQHRYYNDGSTICLNEQEIINYKGWNFVDENYVTHDDIGHGTLVAMSFKSRMNASDKFSVLPVKVLDSCGYGTLYTTVCGLYYAKKKGADIVNCSWGMYVNDVILERAIREVSTDAIVVASAGNNSLDLSQAEHYPSEYSDLNQTAGYNKVVEVAGLCHDYTTPSPNIKQFWTKSNFNKNNYAESAVGFSALITDIPPDLKLSSFTECTCNGTSYSAPLITATIAKGNFNDIPEEILFDKRNDKCL